MGIILGNKADSTDEIESAAHLNTDIYPNNVSYQGLQNKLIANRNVVVFFYKPECQYCKLASPKVLQMAEQYETEVVYFDINKYPEGFDEYGVDKVPTIAIFENGALQLTPEGTAFPYQNPKIGDDTIEGFNQFFMTYF